MNAIIQLQELNWWEFFIGIFIVLFAFQSAVKVWEWFIDKLGIETKWTSNKKNTERKINELELAQIEIMKLINNINGQLIEMQNDKVEEQITEQRWKILKFAADLSNGNHAFRENYDYIFTIYEEYEEILKKNNKENGRVTISMNYIKERYKEALEKGLFMNE